jgi:hypothetical protein
VEARDRASRILEDNWKLHWICPHALNRSVDLSAEIASETRNFRFVPILRLDEFRARRRRKKDVPHYGQ